MINRLRHLCIAITLSSTVILQASDNRSVAQRKADEARQNLAKKAQIESLAKVDKNKIEAIPHAETPTEEPKKYANQTNLIEADITLSQKPLHVQLKESADIPLVINEKTTVVTTLDKGTTFLVKGVKEDKIALEYKGKIIVLPISKTDYQEQVNQSKAHGDLRQEDNEPAEKERFGKDNDEIQPQTAYELAEKNLARMKRTINNYVGPDVEVVGSLIKLEQTFIKEYETGDDKARVAAISARELTWKHILENKPVCGYKYNEFVSQEVIVPITFNIYKNSNSFYIQVGDGAFCTVASLTTKDLLDLFKQLKKILAWSTKCADEKMDVVKDAGSYGGVQLEFVSAKNADHIYVWLTANGQFEEDRLIEKQTVRVNMLNLHALIYRIMTAKDLLTQRDKAKNNADKLQ